ncbi:hypothetical protein PG990_014371 [Apiospora arundinis]
MSDARSLLRAHRAANRIEHPHAAYSDAGKLLCKLCHEAVKSETLWDTHLRSAAHRQKLTALQQQAQQSQQPSSSSSSSRPAAEPTESEQTTTSTNAAAAAPAGTTTTTINHKRKHGVDEDDMDMEDVADAGEDKSRTDAGNRTPPSLTRRSSNPPGQGVEIAIPSRPATPGVNGRSPLIGSGSDSTSTPVTSAPGSFTVTTTAATAPAATSTSKTVDEDEWALFEAEIAVADEDAPAETTNPVSGSEAVISAPALTADQLAAKSQEEENERRKLRFDAELADEREDATRALEDEFDEMEELEARVRRLKEKREELRRGSLANLRATAAGQPDGGMKSAVTAAKGKENGAVAEESEEDEEEEDDEEEFDDGFRFRV